MLYYRICAIFLSIFQLIVENMLKIALEIHQQLPLFTLFLGSDYSTFTNISRNLFNFFFFFIIWLFSLMNTGTPSGCASILTYMRPYCNINKIYLQRYQLTDTQIFNIWRNFENSVSSFERYPIKKSFYKNELLEFNKLMIILF